jgi:uncharacterized protein (TIGR02246 family)
MTTKHLPAIVALALTALLAAGTASARAAAPAPAPVEKELRADADRFAAGWNHADAKAMAALFAEDADFINPFGSSASGRAGIEKFFANELATLTKGTTFAVKGLTARLLRPDLALEDLDIEITGGTIAPDPAMPVKDHAFLVIKKEGGHWLTVALRAFAYQQPPASAPPK